MGELHQKPNEEQCESSSIETQRNNFEKKFADILANKVTEWLDVGYKERDIIKRMLFVRFEEEFSGRRGEGLLEQYLHTQLDQIAKRFISDFDLPSDITPNYNYATHAKLCDIGDAIKDKIPKANPVKDKVGGLR